MGPPLKQLVKDPALKDRVKVVFKHFPLSFHKQAKNASIAAMASQEQGKFWEMHDKIFANQKDLSPENFEKWAGEIGLDIAKYKAYLASGKGEKELEKDAAEARVAGLRGTPTIYVNGRKLNANIIGSPDAMKKLIDQYFPAK